MATNSTTISKNKLGAEDILLDSSEQQSRGGDTPTVINPINASNIRFNDNQTIQEYIQALETRIQTLENA